MPLYSLSPIEEPKINEEPNEPGEEDITTTDHQSFYLSGKLFATVDIDATDTEMWDILTTAMVKASYFPDVWFISDHGNAHLMLMDKAS
jgi:hypothetical protein